MVRRKPTQWEYVPYEHVGPLYFGMTREAALEAMVRKPDDSFDVSNSEHRVDYWKYVLAQYENESITLVEIPAWAKLSVIYEGLNLIKLQLDEFITFIKSHDSDPHIDGTGADSRVLGLGVFAPADEVQGITFFGPGEYPH